MIFPLKHINTPCFVQEFPRQSSLDCPSIISISMEISHYCWTYSPIASHKFLSKNPYTANITHHEIPEIPNNSQIPYTSKSFWCGNPPEIQEPTSFPRRQVLNFQPRTDLAAWHSGPAPCGGALELWHWRLRLELCWGPATEIPLTVLTSPMLG